MSDRSGLDQPTRGRPSIRRSYNPETFGRVSEGVARFLGEQCLVPTQRLIRLQPLFVRVAAGQRLRLSIAAAAWPQIAVNPGDGSVPQGGTSPDHREITLFLDLAKSHLWLEPLTGAN